jgi:bifunctional DNA-binding transcriptional regulator/antitoxin component of YhaV-PrlF toxin-antitoxin module
VCVHTRFFNDQAVSSDISEADEVGEGKVSGNQASIPAHIRRAFDIKDGDTLRWRVVDDELRVSVVASEEGAFDDFEPGSSDEPVDAVEAHDRFGVE